MNKNTKKTLNNKKVYLLNDIYEPYKDELLGWRVTPLKGDISKIKLD